MSQYHVTLHLPQDLWHGSYFLSGLEQLVHEEIITLDYRWNFVGVDTYIPQAVDNEKKLRDFLIGEQYMGNVLRCDVTNNATQRTVSVGIDLNDSPDWFPKYTLNWCDVLFKRHYQQEYVDKLPRNLQHKVKPFGIVFASRFKERNIPFKQLRIGVLTAEVRRVLNRLPLLLQSIHRPRKIGKLSSYFFSDLQDTNRRFKRYNNLRLVSDFEHPCDDEKDPVVFFQTRCWIPRGTRETDKSNLNKQRAAIIRELKSALGEQFRGGFIPDEFAQKHYPDCLTSLSTEPLAYTREVQRAAIVIYTNGVVQSPATKLGEYFAASKCIVAEPLFTELPRPLKHGEEIFFYHSMDELVSICKYLLANPDEYERVSCNVKAYYEAEIKPDKHVLNILEWSFEN